MTTDKVQVAVRVRPVNRRETELHTKCVVDMKNQQTVLYHPQDTPLDMHGELTMGGKETTTHRKAPKSFAFDHCFWSMDKDNPKFASQGQVFENLGQPVLQGAFEGYNGCIFAYGQTGSGKSYTMMGTIEEKGIIPRLCDSLFERIAQQENEATSFKVEVSYMEIYNEKVHDLLDLKGHKQNLKVREHNILGPYVDGLSTLVVTSFEDINNLMSEGNKSRTVAATNMNSESSRSHAVFNIILTQTLTDLKTSVSGEKVSKLSLVDLAGSERAQKTGAMGDRLREGSNINKSLTTLGLVISALAESGKSKAKFVPYRDSVLTWLLKDNLGGNSRTVMVATISPSADNFEETLSTLRYADRAKRIVNHAVVNEDPNARIIRELREEVETLQKELKEAQSMKAPDLKEKLEESEKLLKEMRKTWEEKMAETEQIQVERHKALEEMGVSVETSGIKVQNSRFFLVNLNADPSLNELLVYYLKDKTVVGCPNDETRPDIQLSGLGIHPKHCVVVIEDTEVYVTPEQGARTCVNGCVMKERTRVFNGDRILWGNNHFFRINTPVQHILQTSSQDPDQTIDFNFAQQELMMKEYSNDPISEAISAVEKQYEEDKQEALEQQRQMYEQQMQQLRYQLMSPGTPSAPFPPADLGKLTPSSSGAGIQRKYQQWADERDKMFKHSLAVLRDEVVKANALVREANFLAEEMGKHTEFHVTLQIPASNLSPNRRRGAFVCEPAILVRRKHRGSQVWSMEKIENKIIDMREMYEDRKTQGIPLRDDVNSPPQKGDPFYESFENHNLIGVANIFLHCLFHDVKLDYHVPIISQQGEIVGKLHVELSKLGGEIMDRYADIHCDDSDDDDDYSSMSVGSPIIIRVRILEAKGLPKNLSNFVFCQYQFWGHDEPISVAPEINPNPATNENRHTKYVIFNHERDFKVYMSEEFVEHAQEGALSIEVWGHKTIGFGQQLSQVDSVTRTNSLNDRWLEVTRRVELMVEIQELTEQGEYAPVEVKVQPDVPCAGVFQLRQGHARRIVTRVKSHKDSGTLPLICDKLTSLSIGCICARTKLQKGLDSYQEEDLNVLRERWSDALSRRQKYLDSQIQSLINKKEKSEADSERERALIDQWVSLTEERNAVMVPVAGSGIPGSPAEGPVAPDIEQHRPVLFLDLNSDDMTTPSVKEGSQAAGSNSIIPKEQLANYLQLPILRAYNDQDSVCAMASWDSAIHDNVSLNCITAADTRVYLIVKVILRLSHPAPMEVVLRKRVAVNIKHRNMSLTDKLKKRMWLTGESLHASGVTFDLVSNIPKASEDLEQMESLAQMAASQNDMSTVDGETYIEKYIKGVSAVESILTLDRLRQEVAVKELLAKQGQILRKTSSVPNIHNFMTSPHRLDDKRRFDSIQDLSMQANKLGNATPVAPSKVGVSPMERGRLSMKPLQTLREHKPLLDSDEEDTSFQATKDDILFEDDDHELDDSITTAYCKQEVLDNKQQLLNLKEDMFKLKKSLLEPATTISRSDDFQAFESYESQQSKRNADRQSDKPTGIPQSITCDSIGEGKAYTCSMTSSGYGSQAVSTLTLSSEDSLSLRSNEEVESGRKAGLEHCSSGDSDGDPELTHANKHMHHDHTQHTSANNTQHTSSDNTEITKETMLEQKEVDKTEDIEKENNTTLEDGSNQSNDLSNINIKEKIELHISEEDLSATKNKDDGSNQQNKGNKDSTIDKSKDNDKTSDQNANTSSGMRHSESIDCYSLEAMEELEKLGEDDNSECISMNESNDCGIDSVGNLTDISSSSGHKHTPKLNKSGNFATMNEPRFESTPKRPGAGRSGRDRPMSMIERSDNELSDLSLPNKRSSQDMSDLSEDHISVCSFGSRADLDRLSDVPVPSWVQRGESVMVTSSKSATKMTGVVQFVGNVEFASGSWVGVDLDLPEGKNNGSVNGIQYFKCRPRHGIFVRHDKLILDKKRRGSRKSAANLMSRKSITSPDSHTLHKKH